MEIFIGWLVLSLIVGGLGESRKVGFWGGVLWSLFLSPLIGLIIVLTSKSLRTEYYERKMLEHMDQLTGGKTASVKETELNALADRFRRGELSEYDYNLLKGEVMRKYP